jgi:hypothetical protein
LYIDNNNDRIPTEPSALRSLRSLQREGDLSNTNNTVSRSRNHAPPRVPSPPSLFYPPSNSSHSSTRSSYSHKQRLAEARRGKKPQRDLSPIPEERKRRENWERTSSGQSLEKTSSGIHPYRPPFVREATDGGTELQVLVPRQNKPVHDDIDDAERRAEEMAERAVEIGRKAQDMEMGALEMAEKLAEHDYFQDVERNADDMVGRANDLANRRNEFERIAEELVERGDYFWDLERRAELEKRAEMEVERGADEKHVRFNEKESVHSGTVWTSGEGSTLS